MHPANRSASPFQNDSSRHQSEDRWRLPSRDLLSPILLVLTILLAVVPAVVVRMAFRPPSLSASTFLSLATVTGLGLGALLLLALRIASLQRDLNQAELARQDCAGWIDRIVGATGEGLWIVDLAGRTTYVSQRMAQLLGYSPRDMLGQPLSDFLATRDRQRFGQLRAAAEQDCPERLDLRFRRRDDVRLRASVAVRPILREAGQLGSLLILVADVTELKRARQECAAAQRQLEETVARYGRLIESNIIGIISADLDGRIFEANEAFLQMVGHTREELHSGRLRWTELTPPDSPHAEDQALQELWASGACTPYEKELLHQDGRRVPALIGLASLERYPRRYIGFVLDLSERERAERELRQAKEAAEAAGHAKDQFLAILSHELRTPLNPVLTIATALLDEPETPREIRSALEAVRRNVELEARLIDDLLDVTRIGRGKLKLLPRVVDAHALLRQVLQICHDEIRTGHFYVDVDLTARDHYLRVDPTRLQQVLWNLVKNAVKFTSAGGRLTIRSRNAPGLAEGPGRPRLVVEVSDTGVGIAPEVLPRIFEAFEQGPTAAHQQFGGLGLGLAISRAIVEAHGGTLVATSAGAGCGATFTLELATVAAPVSVAETPPPIPGGEPAPRPLRILLVEDNPDTLRYLTLILRRRGHAVTPVDTLSSALRTLSEEDFDLILSDIELPDGTGLDLMRTLGRERAIPGIAMSGFGSDEDVAQSRSAGFGAHLTKPVDFRTLEALIRETARHSDMCVAIA